MSATPRTEQRHRDIVKTGTDWHHSATLMEAHAEKLETELNAVRACFAEASQDNVIASARIVELEGALSALIHDVQEWCDAVDHDASWDGWDGHYKALKWGGLDKARQALPKPAGKDTMTRAHRFMHWGMHQAAYCDLNFSSKDGLYADLRVQAAFEGWILKGEPDA